MMLIAMIFLIATFTVVDGRCQLLNSNNHTEAIHSTMMKWKIYEKIFTTNANGIQYSIGICTGFTSQSNNTAAIEQKQNEIIFHLGHYDKSNLVQGTNWIMLQYQNGDRYSKEDNCDEDRRVASIIFMCGTNLSAPIVIQDSSNNDTTCNYLFEMQVPEMCSTQTTSRKLGGGAIFLIVLFSVSSAYLILGCLFMHFIRGARGINRIPNLRMWQNLGSLAADGCQYCCRCDRNPFDLGYTLQQSEPDEQPDDELLST